MGFPQNEIYNKHHYMWGIVEFGRVSTVDPVNAKLTVSYADTNYQSGPMQWLHRSCYGAQCYDMPTVGDTAMVLHSGRSRERGIVLGFLYTKGNPPPWTNGTWRGTLYSDNSYIVYDQGAKNWIINLQGTITLTTVSDQVEAIGGKWTCQTTGKTQLSSQSTFQITS